MSLRKSLTSLKLSPTFPPKSRAYHILPMSPLPLSITSITQSPGLWRHRKNKLGIRPRFNHSSATYLTKSLYLSKPQFPCVENGANNNNTFFQGLWGELNM